MDSFINLDQLEADILRQLLHMSLSLTEQMDEATLAEVMAMVANATQAESAVLLLKNTLPNSLSLLSAYGLEPERHTASLSNDATLQALLPLQHHAFEPDHLTVKILYEQFARHTQHTVTSALAVPIGKGKVTTGALLLVNKQLDQFDKRDAQIITYLSQQIGHALASAKLSEQWDLIAEIMHEIKTPLMALTAGAELLDYDDGTQEEREQLLGIIQQEAKRMANMTKDFTDLARLESGNSGFAQVSINVGKLIEEVVQIQQAQANEKGIDISTDIVLPLPTVIGDEDRLKQVLINFVSNGIKYNKENGRLHITAMPDDLSLIHI